MPKLIVTKASLPKMMRVLDRWEGKLTWPLFCTKVARVLGVDAVSRHTLMRYEAIQHRFKVRQQELRDATEQEPRDYALEAAKRRICDLEAQVRWLEDTNLLLLEKFRRWAVQRLRAQRAHGAAGRTVAGGRPIGARLSGREADERNRCDHGAAGWWIDDRERNTAGSGNHVSCSIPHRSGSGARRGCSGFHGVRAAGFDRRSTSRGGVRQQ